MKKLAIALAILTGITLSAVGIHDAKYPAEDSRVIWLCGIHGNGTCGPNTPPILIDAGNLFRW